MFAFEYSDPEQRLGLDKSKAETARQFITKLIGAKVSGNTTNEYAFVVSKLRSKKPEDKPVLPTIYLGLARNATAISNDVQNHLVRE